MEETEFILTENWTGKGKILCTKYPVRLNEGDNYIGIGMAGKNVFTCHGKDVGRYEIKVVAKTSDLEWGLSGNNTLSKLQVINL